MIGAKFVPRGLGGRFAFCIASKVSQLQGSTLKGCDFIVPITLRVISAVQKPLVYEATSHGVSWVLYTSFMPQGVPHIVLPLIR